MRRHSRATTSWMVGASTSVQHGHTATSLLRRAFVASYSTTSAKALSSKGLWTSTSTQPMHASMYAFTTQRRGYVAVGDNFSIKVPPIAESVSSGKLKEWTVKVGDSVAEDQELCHIESDKLEIPVRSPCAGVIVALHASEGDVVDVGKEIVLMTKRNAAAPAASAPPTPSAPTHAPPVAASPTKPTTAAATIVSSAAPVVGDAAAGGGTRRVRTSAMRLRIADRLKASQNTAAMLTTFNEIDMHNLINLREKHKDEFLKKHGVKLGFMSAFAKASASALQEVPIVNASWEDEHVVYHDYVDISVAVATPTGLVVPVLRNVQSMSFADVEKKVAEFGKKAKDKTITLAEMTGGTFTISNGGVFGSWLGTPIINPPQSAILGVHATKQKPWVAEDGKTIVVRPIMAVALTYDHRLIDGRDAVTFLVKIKNIIEDPQRLLLDL